MALLASHGGICPLCSKYIAKGRSRIVRLPEPLVPRGDSYRSADDGGFYNADGSPISMRPREWAHEKCAAKYRKQPDKRSRR